MLRRLLTGLLLASASVMPAHAEWREASTKHFIVYSEGSEERLVEAATKLEKYDFVLRWASKVKDSADPVKLKIYLMANTAAVQDTLPYSGSGIAGYYNASARGPIAVSTRSGTGGQDGLEPQAVLFHEYAHHFMFQHFPVTYPSWYSEGFAEYYGTTRILEKDVIEVGHAARHRYSSFETNSWLPLNKMLTAKSYSDVGGNLYLMYAEGWLLVHYLANNKERSGQLQKYLNAINAGVPYQQAMDDAFGKGAKDLNAELRAYSGRSRIMAVSLPFKPIEVGPINVRTLGPAEQDLIEYDITLGGGVLRRTAAKFSQSVRSAAARHQNDPYALRILTEASRAAGDTMAAAQSVERWLAVRPGDGLALMHKAELQIEALRAAKSTDKNGWEGARKLILAANKAAPGNPQILLAYYNSFVSEGVLPPPGAQNALVRAFELVPQDSFLRQQVAMDFENRGMIEAAIAVIKPAAFELHGEDETDDAKKKKDEALREKFRTAGDNRTETAREMLTRLEKKLAEKKSAG